MKLNWLTPLDLTPKQPRPVVKRKTDGAVMPDTSREVTIRGVTYASMAQAKAALGWSYTRIYFAIGEGWRCKGKKVE